MSKEVLAAIVLLVAALVGFLLSILQLYVLLKRTTKMYFNTAVSGLLVLTFSFFTLVQLLLLLKVGDRALAILIRNQGIATILGCQNIYNHSTLKVSYALIMDSMPGYITPTLKFLSIAGWLAMTITAIIAIFDGHYWTRVFSLLAYLVIELANGFFFFFGAISLLRSMKSNERIAVRGSQQTSTVDALRKLRRLMLIWGTLICIAVSFCAFYALSMSSANKEENFQTHKAMYEYEDTKFSNWMASNLVMYTAAFFFLYLYWVKLDMWLLPWPCPQKPQRQEMKEDTVDESLVFDPAVSELEQEQETISFVTEAEE